MPEAMDWKARDLASQAITQAQRAMDAIAAHEKECATSRHAAQQWRDGTTRTLDRLEDAFSLQTQELKNSIRSIYGRGWWAMGSVVAALSTVVLALGTYILQGHH